jgi:hypothetical protein
MIASRRNTMRRHLAIIAALLLAAAVVGVIAMAPMAPALQLIAGG